MSELLFLHLDQLLGLAWIFPTFTGIMYQSNGPKSHVCASSCARPADNPPP